MIDWLSVVGGAGLFLVSLRTLTRVLQHSLSHRLRATIERLLGSPWKCILAGVLATAVVQASSITIIATMGLCGSTLIGFEQGYFLMLGATLGTTLKAWFLSANVLRYGPALVGACSLTLLFVRRDSWREVIETCLSIGFAFWGLDLMTAGLKPLCHSNDFRAIMMGFPADSLYHQFLGISAGTLLAMVIQSSSAAVAMTLSLASQGAISFPQGAALILGANLGTTFSPLVASLEHGAVMRRVAVSHLLVKLLGVLITLLFFPQFVNAIDLLVPDRGSPGQHIEYQLAAVHTLFNLLNVLTFAFLSAPMIRLTLWLVAGPGESALRLALAPVVRRILARNPERSLEEARRQMGQLMLCVKAVLDRAGHILAGEHPEEMGHEERLFEYREFEGLRHSIQELSLQCLRRSPPEELERQARAQLWQLSNFEELYYQAWRLRDGLEDTSDRLPGDLRQSLEGYQRTVDELWLCILFAEDAPRPALDPHTLVQQVAETYFSSLKQQEQRPVESLTLTFETLQRLRIILVHLSQLATHSAAQ